MGNVRLGNVDSKNVNFLEEKARSNALLLSGTTLRTIDLRALNPSVATMDDLSEIDNNINEMYDKMQSVSPVQPAFEMGAINIQNIMPEDNLYAESDITHENSMNNVPSQTMEKTPTIQPIQPLQSETSTSNYESVITPFNDEINMGTQSNVVYNDTIAPLDNKIPTIEEPTFIQKSPSMEFSSSFAPTESEQVNAAINSEILSPKVDEPRREVYSTIEPPQDQNQTDSLVDAVIMIEDTRKNLIQKTEELKRDAIKEIEKSAEELKARVVDMLDKRISLLKNEFNDGLTEASRNVESARNSHQNDMNTLKNAVSMQSNLYSSYNANNTYGRAA